MADIIMPTLYVCDMFLKIIIVFFCRIRILFKEYSYLCGQKYYDDIRPHYLLLIFAPVGE